MKREVVLDPSDQGGFTVYVPSLPSCIGEGDTEEEALTNIKEAIELYVSRAGGGGGSVGARCTVPLRTQNKFNDVQS
ncbi:MAG: type II toxin-antitoxin system HicB family antitoxin [Chloroflexi bacterium]|nr:type II toxin-antitoxin system HicB family antitoxin [Chloroflexota bacterium]